MLEPISFVHVYNGMSGLHHREPGMVGAALNLKDVYAEMIAMATTFISWQAGGQGKRASGNSPRIADCMRAGEHGRRRPITAG